MAKSRIEILVELIDKASGPARDVAKALNGLSGAGGAKGVNGLTASQQKLGRAMAPVTARFGQQASAAVSFGKAMSKAVVPARQLVEANKEIAQTSRAVTAGIQRQARSTRDLVRGMGDAGRKQLDHLTHSRRLAQGMGAYGSRGPAPMLPTLPGQPDRPGRPRRPGEIASRRRRGGLRSESGFGALRGEAGAILGGIGAAGAYKQAAAFDRRITMIGQTADASRGEIDGLAASVHTIAQQTATPVDQLAGGLESLVAQGRNLKEAMEFLPSVARTAAASGSAVDDIAKSADSVASNFNIAGKQMQSAFDIMAAGGKAGQFELKDMAQYLPSISPSAKAAGFNGQAGLADTVAMLQVIRKGTGSAGEAAISLTNIFNKMESEETTKKFAKMGVDLPKAMAKGRKEGRNLVEVFEEAAQIATKGDLSKLPNLIADQEFSRGIRALMTYRGEWQKLSSTLQRSAGGTVARDIVQVTQDSQAGLDRAKNSFDRFTQAAARGFDVLGGSGRLQGIAGEIEAVATALEHVTAAFKQDGLKGVGDQIAKGAEAVKGAAEAKLDEIKLRNADSSVTARQTAIRAKEKELADAEAEAAKGGLWSGSNARGRAARARFDLDHLRKGLPEIERQRDITKAGPRPLRFGTDPTAPIQGRPGAITPGTQSWQNAYPLSPAGRNVPLPPQRPAGLPTSGAPQGINSIDDVLSPKVDTSQIEGAKPKADEARAAIEGLNLTVTPNVNAGSIAAAQQQANALLATLGRIGSAADGAAARVASASAQASSTARMTLDRSKQTSMTSSPA